MVPPPATTCSGMESGWPRQALSWMPWLFLTAGFISIGYCLYDLAYPGHFVGDMYGLEVIVRLATLCVPSVLLLVAGVGAQARWVRERRWLHLGMVAFMALPLLMLANLAGDVAASREQDRIRAGYPLKSTDELLRIAHAEKDTFAVYELLARKDPAAVPGLCDILLDEEEGLALRDSAAHALGEIGGQEARSTLEKVQAGCPEGSLRTAVDYALEVRIGQRSGPD